MKPLAVGMILFTKAWTNWTASRVPRRHGGQGSTSEKTGATEILFHIIKSWLHGVKLLLCPLLAQA